MAKVIAIINQKGGVGKTTTCGMMIDYLCKAGKGPLLALSRFSLPAGVTLDYTAQKGCALTIAAQIL